MNIYKMFKLTILFSSVSLLSSCVFNYAEFVPLKETTYTFKETNDNNFSFTKDSYFIVKLFDKDEFNKDSLKNGEWLFYQSREKAVLLSWHNCEFENMDYFIQNTTIENDPYLNSNNSKCRISSSTSDNKNIVTFNYSYPISSPIATFTFEANI